MVRVKIIKCPDWVNLEDASRFLNCEFEAFKMRYGDKIEYFCYLEDELVGACFPEDCCEELKCERKFIKEDLTPMVITKQKYLLVKDGCVNIDKLEIYGIPYIEYKDEKPELIEV